LKDIIQDIFICSFAYLIAICTYITIKDFIKFLRNIIDQIVNRKKYRWFKNIKITGTVNRYVREYGRNHNKLSWMDYSKYKNGENYTLYLYTDKKSLYVGNILLLGNVSDEEIKTFIEKKLKYKFRHFLDFVNLKKKATKIIDENGKIEWEIK
jgi:hypothetical protein